MLAFAFSVDDVTSLREQNSTADLHPTNVTDMKEGSFPNYFLDVMKESLALQENPSLLIGVSNIHTLVFNLNSLRYESGANEVDDNRMATVPTTTPTANGSMEMLSLATIGSNFMTNGTESVNDTVTTPVTVSTVSWTTDATEVEISLDFQTVTVPSTSQDLFNSTTETDWNEESSASWNSAPDPP